MVKTFHIKSLICTFGLLMAVPAVAQKKQSGAKSSKQSASAQFETVKRKHRDGELSDSKMWAELDKLYAVNNQLPRNTRAQLLQSQAFLLQRANFPIIASIYASQGLMLADTPLSNEFMRSWDILRKVSTKHPIQNLLEVLAAKLDVENDSAPEFETDWAYFSGNTFAKAGKVEQAIKAYRKVKITDRYFFPARYQEALLHYETGNFNEAEVALKAVLYPTSQNLSPIANVQKERMADMARMALARIFYEKKEFMSSVRLYRQVMKTSPEYYDALFEQSWAFFMAGYPAHALGALHAVRSPFYKDVFNPEATILQSIVYYWLCRYNDSRNSLADFTENHQGTIESLGKYLDRARLTPETSYQLFENLVSGVSSDSLGIPRTILETAAERDSMLLVRDQYASVLEERARLVTKGVFGKKDGLGKPTEYLDRWVTALREDLGTNFLSELKDLKSHYDRLYDQAQFLYVELLMSEKEKILGKELHASSKITKVSETEKVRGWGNETQSWAGSEKNEYWWDEIGFYIYKIDSQCTSQ